MGKRKKKNKNKHKLLTDVFKPKNNVKVIAKCHEGFTEIYPNIFVGKALDIDVNLLNKVDILVPLAFVDGEIWDTGWRGSVIYIPIEDYGTLPEDVERYMVEKMLRIIKKGKSIAIFCSGGHGRTGYFTSLLLGKLGVEDPIELLRDKYCKNAVETDSQIKAIARFLDKPELNARHFATAGQLFDYYNQYYSVQPKKQVGFHQENTKRCMDCIYFGSYADSYYGSCDMTYRTKNAYEATCNFYEPDI